jgi:hypothetical protein
MDCIKQTTPQAFAFTDIVRSFRTLPPPYYILIKQFSVDAETEFNLLQEGLPED